MNLVKQALMHKIAEEKEQEKEQENKKPGIRSKIIAWHKKNPIKSLAGTTFPLLYQG